MQPQNQPTEDTELRIRSMRIIWLALLFSIGGYFAFTMLGKRSETIEPNSMLSLILAVIAMSAVLISFLIKSKLLTKAIDQRQVPQVQQAYVVAWAVTEVSALLGVLDYFIAADRYYYIFFLIAAFVQLLHFPRSEHVNNAAFKPADF